MKNKISIIDVAVSKHSIVCKWNMSGDWTKVLNGETYKSVFDVDISNVPKSIAILPFLSNIIPIAWLFDLEIEIDELDKTFYEQLDDILLGYKKMYPDIKFKGNIIVKKIIETSYCAEKTAVLFSGGVDAICTVLNNIEDRPDLITIFGADISLGDSRGIGVVRKNNIEVSKKMGLLSLFVSEPMKAILNYDVLNEKLTNIRSGLTWYHDFQHGIALICATAPLSFVNGYKLIYIASSFTVGDMEKYHYTCASDPLIDNYIKFGNTEVRHDGYELSRQDKISSICEYEKKYRNRIPLRVCWLSEGGKNCCNCEKCYRTILGILLEGAKPENMGFNQTKTQRKKMMLYLKHYLPLHYNGFARRYAPIVHKAQANKKIVLPEDMEWIRSIKLNSKEPNWFDKLLFRLDEKCSRMKSKITNRIKKNDA